MCFVSSIKLFVVVVVVVVVVLVVVVVVVVVVRLSLVGVILTFRARVFVSVDQCLTIAFTSLYQFVLLLK